MPVLLDCNFVVDEANPNGLGQRSLKGPGIKNVFMHTTAPLVGSGNPNPALGFAMVTFDSNYYRYFGGFEGFVSQLSGAPILVTAGLTIGTTYVIALVGTTTQAEWESLGLPHAVKANVGVAFVATSAAAGTGTGVVEVPATNGSGVNKVEVIGDPNQSLTSGNGTDTRPADPYIIVRFMAGEPAVATQPADNSVCGMAFYLSNSSQQLAGE